MTCADAPRLVRNRDVRRGDVGPLADDCGEFHRRLPGFGPTPVRSAVQLAHELGVASVHVKDESQRMGLPAFKILGASWATYRAISDELGLTSAECPSAADLADQLAACSVPIALTTATDGNHGRAVARMAKILGVTARIFVPARTVTARVEGIESEGASVEIVPGSYDDAVRASAAYAESNGALLISDTSWEGYTTVPSWVIDGYSTMINEVLADIDSGTIPEPDVVAIQLGVGAVGAAVVRGFASRSAREIVSVEPSDADCIAASIEAGECVSLSGGQESTMAGLNCGTPSAVAWPDVRAGFTACATVTDEHAKHAMRLLAADAITSGESGAAGAAGLLAHGAGLLRPTDHILVFSTEGATDPLSYARITN